MLRKVKWFKIDSLSYSEVTNIQKTVSTLIKNDILAESQKYGGMRFINVPSEKIIIWCYLYTTRKQLLKSRVWEKRTRDLQANGVTLEYIVQLNRVH